MMLNWVCVINMAALMGNFMLLGSCGEIRSNFLSKFDKDSGNKHLQPFKHDKLSNFETGSF